MLTYEEFFEDMWDYVSSKVVDDHYYFEHEPLMRSVTKDLYDIYCCDGATIHPKFYARCVESFFFHSIKAAQEKDKIDYNTYRD